MPGPARPRRVRRSREDQCDRFGRQLAAAWADCPEAFATTPVTAALDPAPPIVAPTATVRTAARMIRDYRSDVVVIIGLDRAPIGVVTASDLLAGIVSSGKVDEDVLDAGVKAFAAQFVGSTKGSGAEANAEGDLASTGTVTAANHLPEGESVLADDEA